jgi:hypothetical protein
MLLSGCLSTNTDSTTARGTSDAREGEGPGANFPLPPFCSS